MIVVKLAPGSDIEFETREQLEEYIEHVNNEVSAYAILQRVPGYAADFMEWVSDQYGRADSYLFCAIECRKEFDDLEHLYKTRMAEVTPPAERTE